MTTFRLFSVTLFALLCAVQAETVFIIEQPWQVRLLDKYEQTPAVPPETGMVLRLQETQHTLSDGITEAMRCTDANGDAWFIFPGQNGLKQYRRATWIGDTVTTTRKLQLQTTEGGQSTLSTGSTVRRLFRFGKRTYVRAGFNGWINLSATDFTKVTEAGADNQFLPPALQQRIRTLVADANRSLRELAGFFYHRSGQQVALPQWELSTEYSFWTISLRKEDSHPFKNSRLAMQQELQRFLLDTPYRVAGDSTQLRIQRQR